MPTSAKDLVSSYGHALDFDRLLATPKTIAICWCVAALLTLASGLPITLETIRSLACGAASQHDRLADDPVRVNLTAVAAQRPSRG